MRKIIGLIGVHVVAMLILSGYASGSESGDVPGKALEKAPPFEVVTMKGEIASLDGLLSLNEAIFLNFWGLRCSACIQEIPHINRLYSQYKGRVSFLGVNADGVDAAYLQPKVGKGALKIEYEIVPDPGLKLIDLFKMTAAPLTIIIDRKKIVRYRHENFEDGDEVKIEQALKDCLAGEAPAK
ncbi:MAG: TlpA disulfide reductase family protein [bacterium]|jgi:thiol-disulfide isomerase/thioredoxin